MEEEVGLCRANRPPGHQARHMPANTNPFKKQNPKMLKCKFCNGNFKCILQKWKTSTVVVKRQLRGKAAKVVKRHTLVAKLAVQLFARAVVQIRNDTAAVLVRGVRATTDVELAARSKVQLGLGSSVASCRNRLGNNRLHWGRRRDNNKLPCGKRRNDGSFGFLTCGQLDSRDSGSSGFVAS